MFGEFGNRTWQELAEKDLERARGVATWQTGEVARDPATADHADEFGNYYPLSEIPEMYPATIQDQPFSYPDKWWRARDGPTRINGIARVELGLEALTERHEDGDTVAIVCHTQSGAGIVSSLTDFPHRHQHRLYSFDNTGITRLDRRSGDRWLVSYANRVEHLPPELRT